MASPPIALISGANTGIGLAVATQLARDHGYHVIIGSRSASAGQSAAETITSAGHSASSVQLDITSDESIAAAVKHITTKYGRLDVLVNNAGVLLDQPAGQLDTRALFTQTLAVNVVGTACLTEACEGLLRKADAARLVFVSSRMGSLKETLNRDTLYYKTDYKAYDASKAAVNMLALNWERIFYGTGIMVNVACPGLVQTKMTRYTEYGATTDVGATRIVELATAKKGGPSGTYSDRDGPIPW
ncbi:hypothetical protein ANO11243_093400 [Dothideomycetidae sp. 11243]|nr:hypothetical protein ANO11243_093400 [fungal sp. No.11243]